MYQFWIFKIWWTDLTAAQPLRRFPSVFQNAEKRVLSICRSGSTFLSICRSGGLLGKRLRGWTAVKSVHQNLTFDRNYYIWAQENLNQSAGGREFLLIKSESIGRRPRIFVDLTIYQNWYRPDFWIYLIFNFDILDTAVWECSIIYRFWLMGIKKSWPGYGFGF